MPERRDVPPDRDIVAKRESGWEECNEAGLGAFQSGNYTAAEGHFRKAVNEAQRSDTDAILLAKSLNNLAETCRVQGKYAEAEQFYRQSVAIKERVLGEHHPDVATGLSNLAGVHYARGDLAGAAVLFKRALAILEGALGPAHPDVAKILANLAGVYHMQQRSTEAEALYRLALEIRERALGTGHPDVVRTLVNLATVCQALGKQDEAETLQKRAAAIEAGAQESRAGLNPAAFKGQRGNGREEP